MICTEKTIRNADAILDCIPLVSSVSNLLHLACKVDLFNPASSGLRMGLKIHALSKSSFDCCVGLVPVLGNLLKLVQLVSRALSGYKELTYMEKAILQGDAKVLMLCLKNGPSKEAAKQALLLAARQAPASIFVRVLHYRTLEPSGGWEAADLLDALSACRPQATVSEDEREAQEEKAHGLIGFWALKNFSLSTLSSGGLRERICCSTYSEELRIKIEETFFPKPPPAREEFFGPHPRTSWIWGKYKTTS